MFRGLRVVAKLIYLAKRADTYIAPTIIFILEIEEEGVGFSRMCLCHADL